MVFQLVAAAHKAGLTSFSLNHAVHLVSRLTLRKGERNVLEALARAKQETWLVAKDDEDAASRRGSRMLSFVRSRVRAPAEALTRGRKNKGARGPNRILEPTEVILEDEQDVPDDLSDALLDPLEADLGALRKGLERLLLELDPELAESVVRGCP